jgi:hypothetical protein
MYIVLTPEDCVRLKPEILREILAYLFGRETQTGAGRPATAPGGTEGMAFTGVVDLEPEQVSDFMSGLQHKTKDCLRVVAEHGPVTDAKLLGIENYSHFQASLTKRIRTITGDKNARLITWGDWVELGNGDITFYYAVTIVTHKSLRMYFGLQAAGQEDAEQE